MTTFSYPLVAGGGACAIWSWLLAGAGALSLALSSAEIASAYPTAGKRASCRPWLVLELTSSRPGALYFTLRFLAPKEHVPIVSWVCGTLHHRERGRG